MPEKDGVDRVPLTEPLVIQCVFASGIEVLQDEGIIRVVAWVLLPAIGGEMTERRIVSRMVITPATGRDLASKLRTILRSGH